MAPGISLHHDTSRNRSRTGRRPFEDVSITEDRPVVRGGRRRPPDGSARELRARGWRAVGIDATAAGRLDREHVRLRSCAGGPRTQTACEVLDLDERARLMRRIAA